MHVGLMLFDDSDASLEDKLITLRQRAFERLGYEPTVCHVGVDMIDKSDVVIDGVRLIQDAMIPHNHFWLGRNDA